MTSKTLISGGCVLTLGARTPNFAQADVLIEDGLIVEVGEHVRARDAERIDASDTIVMPGFVDTHRHAWKSLLRNFRGSAESPPPTDFREHFRPDDVYASTLIGLLGALEAGITTVVDWCDPNHGAEFVEAALEAHAEARLRTVLVDSAGPSGIASGALQERAWEKSRGRLISVAVGHPDPDHSELDAISSSWAATRAMGLRIHVHAGTRDEAAGAVALLGERGQLGPDVTLVHCTNLTSTDLDTVASSGAAVSLTPSAEMAGGLGAPPIQEMIDRSIRPGLGVDAEGVAPGDLFAQMRATISLQHATVFDRKLAGKAGVPNLMTTRDVIRYGTIHGAGAVGLGDVTGSLEVGKAADIVVLRTDRPNISPVNDPIGAVVWGMDTSNIDWVFVEGRAVMSNGELEHDVAEARRLATDAQRRVVAAAGIDADTTWGAAPS